MTDTINLVVLQFEQLFPHVGLVYKVLDPRLPLFQHPGSSSELASQSLGLAGDNLHEVTGQTGVSL